MPLSEREQQLLEQMERALYEEDPKFASALRASTGRPVRVSKMALGIVVFAVGLAGLVAGVSVSFVPLGIIGFLVMVGGVLLGMASLRPVAAGGVAPVQSSNRSGSAVAAPAGGGFMHRFEERWRRRRDADNG